MGGDPVLSVGDIARFFRRAMGAGRAGRASTRQVFKNMTCPRGDDCPYAHAQSEIRHPRSEEEKEKVVDPKDLVVTGR